MTRAPNEILADIRAFEPVDEDWLPLHGLIVELSNNGASIEHARDLLAVFERFSEEYNEVLWSVLHLLEALPGYETWLVQSVKTRPTDMAVTMIGRLLNGGVWQVNGLSLVELLIGVASSTNAPESARTLSAELAEMHSKPSHG
jgi:hypothetical protein